MSRDPDAYMWNLPDGWWFYLFIMAVLAVALVAEVSRYRGRK